MATFALLPFLWNLLPEMVQDKIKEVSVDNIYNFLETTFSEENTLSNAFWKALTQVVAEVYVEPSKEVIKHRFQQALAYPDTQKEFIIFCKKTDITEISHSFENEIYWKSMLTETFNIVQTTGWELEEADKNFFFPLLLAQYVTVKQHFIHYLSDNRDESIKVLLATTIDTNHSTKQILAAIHKLAQGTIGQIQTVNINIKGDGNLVLVDVKGKKISLSLKSFMKENADNKLLEQILYVISDKKEPSYQNLTKEIEQKLWEKRSHLDDYNLYIEGQDLNFNAESSRAIYGKTVADLDKKAIQALLKTELSKEHLLKQGANRKTNVDAKLRALFLMSNGYVVKGTFLCLCSASAIRSINTTADYVSFGVYLSKDRTKIKISDEFYGNLVSQFNQVEDALILSLGSLEMIDLMKRELDYNIPKFVFRELIANAVVHRDYSENAKIHTTVELYEDRFVVRNAGAFPKHINPNDIENIQSKSINKEIARIFFLHNIVQKKGSGIQRVQKTLIERGMRPAVFEEKEGIVSVTVYKKEPITHLFEKAQEYHHKGDYVRELEYREEALAIQEKTLSPDSSDIATTYLNLAGTYKAMGNFASSLAYTLKALQIFQKILPAQSIEIAALFSNLSTIYQDMGDLSRSLEYGLQALEIRQKTLPANHIDLANSYANLASLYENRGDLAQSLAYGLKAVDILENEGATAYHNLVNCYNIVGATYRTMGELAKSLAYELKSLSIRQMFYPPLHPDLATIYTNIGVIYQEMNKTAESLEYHDKALAIRKAIFPADHPALAHSYHNLAIMYSSLKEWERAFSSEQGALIILLKKYPFGHPTTNISVKTMAQIVEALTGEKGQTWAMPYTKWFTQNCSEYLND